MAVERTLYKGKKELSMAEYEALAAIDPNIDYDILDYPTGGITNTQMQFALSCKRLFPVGTVLTCIDDGTYKNNYTYKIVVNESDIKAWEEVTIVIDQDYSIVESEPEDKTAGKMIYLNAKSGVIATVDQSQPEDASYCVPSDIVSKLTSGEVTALDLQDYKYIFSNNSIDSQGIYSLTGFINVGKLTGLDIGTLPNTLSVTYKINNTLIENELFTKYGDDLFFGASDTLALVPTHLLAENLIEELKGYFSINIVNLSWKTTNTIEILDVKRNGVSIFTADWTTFNINNLKIADGSKYTPIKDIIGIDVDSSLSDTSTNPVENKIITAELNKKATIEYVDTKIQESITNVINTPV